MKKNIEKMPFQIFLHFVFYISVPKYIYICFYAARREADLVILQTRKHNSGPSGLFFLAVTINSQRWRMRTSVSTIRAALSDQEPVFWRVFVVFFSCLSATGSFVERTGGYCVDGIQVFLYRKAGVHCIGGRKILL
jgi:hypothetical protein